VLAKRTSKNQITLPKAVADRLPEAAYFEVPAEEGRIVLVPVRSEGAGDVSGPGVVPAIRAGT